MGGASELAAWALPVSVDQARLPYGGPWPLFASKCATPPSLFPVWVFARRSACIEMRVLLIVGPCSVRWLLPYCTPHAPRTLPPPTRPRTPPPAARAPRPHRGQREPPHCTHAHSQQQRTGAERAGSTHAACTNTQHAGARLLSHSPTTALQLQLRC